jgi:C4-dicarboxylate-specific signal transduction histidine kinase
LLFRAFSLMEFEGNPNFVQEGVNTKLIAEAALLSSIVEHFAYVGLTLDRLRRRELTAATVVPAFSDSIQLSQILLNLLRNAIQAMGQTLNRQIQVHSFTEDGQAMLRVRDTRPGFEPETLGRVGTPFFTTKPNSLDIGISVSWSIATQHPGSLYLSNADAKDRV